MTTRRTAARKTKHDKSIAHWQEQVRNLKAERILTRAILRECEIALTDWVRTFAPSECGKAHVNESIARIMDAGGTLIYVARLLARIRKALR